MKKTFVILILINLLFSCKENEKTNTDEKVVAEFENQPEKFDPIAYVSNPNKTDTLCLSEIEKAKSDIKKEGIVKTQAVVFLYEHNRNENELKELCKSKGLKYDIDLIGCVVFEGQTQGCYGSYMDKVLAENFGQNFKENMHKQADSLFLDNVIKENIAVQYWDCDERPRLPNEKERSSDYIPYVTVKNIEIKQGDQQHNDWPFFDLGFIVQKDSTISNFYVSNYVPNFKENENIENELFRIAVKHLKDNYPIWVPGKINGIQVKTDNNVRIHFKN